MGVSIYSHTPAEGTKEYYLLISPGKGYYFAEQVQSVFETYQQALKDLHLSLDSGVSLNFYLSDAANQEDYIRNTIFYKALIEAKAAVLIVQMPPYPSKVVLFAYHIESAVPTSKHLVFIDGFKENHSCVSVSRNGIEQVYLKNCLSSGTGTTGEQTRNLLEGLNRYCTGKGLSLKNVVRTWFYVYDIDTNYGEMNSARTAFFNECNLSLETGFPASTGIEGRTKNQEDLICMEAIILNGIGKNQVNKMQAPTNMNPTIEYKVMFERGIEVMYGDRRHLYISGTASISNKGNILHEGDVIKQAERALENISALLNNSGATLNDMAYLVVYLRDISDFGTVDAYLKKVFSNSMLYVIILGNICRPGWLIEIEGIAISGKGKKEFPPF